MVYTDFRVKKICCVGAGYVGGSNSTVLAYHVPDVDVTVVDINAARIASWNSDILPFSEPGLLNMITHIREGSSSSPPRQPNLFFSTDVDKAIREADLIFVAVATPSGRVQVRGGAALDLASFHTVMQKIGETTERDFILVNKSTVPCGAAAETQKRIRSFLRAGVRCEVLSNPEFMAEATAIQDLHNPDRILIGSSLTNSGRAAAAALVDLYAKWVPRDRILTMSSQSSELSKLAANALLAQRISSINALSTICDELGANITEVSRACGLDHRIGRHMLGATLGFGGSCFKKDVLHLTHTASHLGLYDAASFFEGIISINEYQTERFANHIISKVPNHTGPRTIGILGFAFKPDTDDTRESPAISVVQTLLLRGYFIKIFDPLVPPSKILLELRESLAGARHWVDRQAVVCSDVYGACKGTDAVAILNPWDSLRFDPPVPGHDDNKQLWTIHTKANAKANGRTINGHARSNGSARVEWDRIAITMKSPKYIFDGHNVLDPSVASFGFNIDGIGRRGQETDARESTDVDLSPFSPDLTSLPSVQSGRGWEKDEIDRPQLNLFPTLA